MFKEADFLDKNFYKIIDLVSANIYWKDIHGRYLGCNKCVLNQFGLSSPNDLIGKTDLEALLVPKHEALRFVENDQFALKHGTFEGEESGTVNGSTRTYFTKKIVFFNDKGKIAGVIGTSLDITNQKKLMTLELEKQKIILEEQLKIKQIIDSVDASIYWRDGNTKKYLGCNQYMLNMFGIKNRESIIGKTTYDLVSKDDARKINDIDEFVLANGHYEGEESFRLPSGEAKTYYTVKNQLFDSDGNVVGLVGASIDITNQKKLLELEKQKFIYEEQLKVLQIIDSVSASIYWKDQKGEKYLGCNRYMLNMLGFETRESIIGKTEYDLLSNEDAQKINEVDMLVLANGHYEGEESFRLPNGKARTYYTVKNRLADSNGNITGLVGTSLDITEQKEAESLREENEIQKTIAHEQDRFKKIADQVAHDIRSPLASMLMIVKACHAIPERERVALREAATTINDIANNLLNTYVKKEARHDQTMVEEERESILISPIILQILTDKKYQYQNFPIKFEHHFSQMGSFAWIKIEPTAFKRMLSNIINNAVDAFVQKEGKISLFLDADDDHVRITIGDDGKGMAPELVQKIIDHIAVTEDKLGGHGIGLTQVRETLVNNEGQWTIDSQVGVGTKITLTFPRVQSKNWIAETIQLHDDDIVVILDDDSSIHLAWDTRFDRILEDFPNLTVKHFEMSQEAVDFINHLPMEKKHKVFLLTDYELLKQDLNGLDVIKKTGISRSILVTSHYANKPFRRAASETETKILPKQLASEILINIIPPTHRAHQPKALSAVDVIFVDDDQNLLDSFTFLCFNKTVHTYSDPQRFLNSVSQYHKNTKIILDYHFVNFDQQGIQIAAQLHELGFTRLYLLSGTSLLEQQVPDYLTVVQKTDLARLEEVLRE